MRLKRQSKTVNGVNASSHSIMQLEGLPTLPKLHTGTGRKGYASIITEREPSPRVTDKLLGKSIGISPGNSSTWSPRTQQRKTDEAEKKSCSPTSRKLLECSVSPRGRLRLKQSQEQKNREHVDEIISERRISNCRADESSPASNISTVPQPSIWIQKKSLLSVHQDASETELPSIAHEQLSPVLVQDDGPCTLNSLQDHGKLAQLKVLGNMQNPDNKYVSDILLAAGFFNKESAIPLQQHIKPDLFSVLEKQHWQQKPSAEKNHRKLVFDVVSEILAHKNPCEFFLQRRRTLSGQQLLREICTEIQGLQARNRRWSTTSEDCVELISCEDIIDRSEGWEDFCMERIRVPLQIGRLIFHDLISEIVGEAALQTKQTKIRN